MIYNKCAVYLLREPIYIYIDTIKNHSERIQDS